MKKLDLTGDDMTRWIIIKDSIGIGQTKERIHRMIGGELPLPHMFKHLTPDSFRKYLLDLNYSNPIPRFEEIDIDHLL